MTVAEMVVLVVALLLLVWALRPLQHWVRDRLERLFLKRRHGRVIEGKFRSVPTNPAPPDPGPEKPPNGDRQ
jgi:hypothetical protein